jgi:3',5'-cyclic AMP phosphodiesterase CpdA
VRIIATLVVAAAWAAAQEPRSFFDTAATRPALPAPPAAAKAKPAGIPQDLSAARARVGNAAQADRLARLNPAAKDSFTLAVIGDAEPGRFAWERVFSPGKDAYGRLMTSISAARPDLVFQLGDMVSKGTVENYRERVKYLDGAAGLPIFSVVGNHDRSAPNGSADKKLYDAVFGPGDFFVDYNGWRLVGLDTADRTLTAAQLAWLKTVLVPGPRKLLFTHVPPGYLKGKLNTCAVPALDSKTKKEGYIHDVLTAYFDENSAAFEDLMVERGVERVYFGHIHAFGMAERRGVRYVLSGGGGSPLFPLPATEPQCLFAHYIRVRLGPGKIRETVHTLDGREFDLP